MSEPVMASIICTNFAQNAWKKDLCSNCFKSEVEHNNCSVGSSHPTTTTTTQTLTKTDKQNDNHFHTNEETNGKTNHSAIKPLAKSANIFTSNNFIQQINTNNSIQKSVPKECIKTSGNINGNHINVKKFSTNINTLTINSGNNNNQLNSQIVMNNTKIKLNSTHVSSQQSLVTNQQMINGLNYNTTKDNNNATNHINVKHNNNVNNSSNNINNNCNDFRKVGITDKNNTSSSSSSTVNDKKESCVNYNTTYSKCNSNNNNNTDTDSNNKLLVKNTVNSDSTERNGIIPLLQQQQQKSSKSENKSFSNNENNLKTNNKSAVVDNLGTNNSVTTNVPNVTNVLNHNKDTNGCGSPVSATNSTLMLTKGILKSQTNEDLIKYRPKNRCIVFKDGDPLVIGCGDIDYEYSSDSDDDYEASDDDTEDDYIYSSDDKELRDLTYKNTLFNANYANFKKFIDNKYKQQQQLQQQTVNQTETQLIDSKQVATSGSTGADNANHIINNNSNDSYQKSIVRFSNTDETLPKVCEKLVEIGLNDPTIDNSLSSGSNCSDNSSDTQAPTPDSGNSDISPMSTSSDSYSSGDEKDDSGSSDFGKDSISTNSIQHLKTDSESDTFSTTSDSSLDIKANYRPEVRSKPELPMKPNMGKINAQTITTTTPMAPVLQIPSAKQSVLPMTLFVNNTNPVEEQEEEMNVNSIQKINDTFTNEEMFKTDDNCVTQIICDPDYQDINESNEEMNGMDGMYSSLSESIDNNYLVDNKEEESISPEAHDKHRVIKLAELAQELEQCRQVKRPAPQPPNSSSPEISDDSIESDYKSTATESKLTIFNNKSETTKQQQLVSSSALNTSSSTPMKQRFSSIRKLLHKKIDKAISDKNKVTISEPTLSTAPDTSSDRKAWKQSEFDRTTIKILHPSDMTTNIQVKQYTTNEQSSEQPPEAPPRAPKVNRPSVPARRRNKSVPNTGLLAHQREPPPPVPVVLHHKTLEKSSSLPIHTNITITANNITNTSIHQKAPIAETTVQNSLNEAYNQLAKSNLSNLLAIKLKIESKCSQQLYKWTDFEVTTALTLGSVKVYKDCIVSDTRKFVNLVVLSDCYCAPIVNQFRVHNELVLVLDYKWTQFCLLDSMSAKTFEQKQINSLILQLYSILEYFESHRYNQLPENIVNTIIIGASNDDILLIIPLNNDSTDSNIGSQITLHQFLSQMLAKLLPNSLFASVGHDLTQPSIQINQSKTIVQMIAFYIPVHEMCNTSNDADTDRQINYWFDINRSKFINQFCCLTDTNVLTQLDYIYLNFLCNHSIDMIRNVLPLMNSFTNN